MNRILKAILIGLLTLTLFSVVFPASAQASSTVEVDPRVKAETLAAQAELLNLDKQFNRARAASWSCREKIDRKDITFPNEEYSLTSVIYKYCYRAGSYAKAKPKRAIYSYNMPGTHMTCDRFLRRYDGMTFNMYFWRPFTGENYNPGGVSVTCDESTMNSVMQFFSADAPYLEWGPGNGRDRQPRWKVVVTLKKNRHNDVSKAHSQDFKPF